MNKIIVALLLFICGAVHAQKAPSTEPRQVRIYESDKTVLASIDPVRSPRRAKPGLNYSWYGANVIQTTQGGFNGKLLNGRYTEFYLNKNLKEEGTYTKGLKTGIWKTWNEDGTLKQVTSWKKGILVPKDAVSLWKKIKRFIRHKKA